MTATVGLDRDTLDMMLDSLDEFVAAALPDQRRLELDREDICPEETIRAMCGEDLGVQLVFIPEEYGGLSIRELLIAVTSREQFVGTPAHIADEIDRYVQADACDGFILVPHLTPHGLDEFVDRVVPLLQEHGAFRAQYSGETLREHLGLSGLASRAYCARG